ncbi:MAG: hypothetical protein ACOC1K_07860 [Nanoarchaeota archaeon]
MVNRLNRNKRVPVKRSVERETKIVSDLAYYTNVLTGTITQNNNIPLNEKLLLGKDITSVDSYSIRLNNGVYKVIFNLIGEPSQNGLSSVTLYVNGQPTNISSVASSVQNSLQPLSSNGIVVSTNNSTIISLVNTSDNPHIFRNVNLTVEKWQ